MIFSFHFHPFSTLDTIKGCSEMVSIRVFRGLVTSNMCVNHFRTLLCVRGWKRVRGFKSVIPQRYLSNSFPTKLYPKKNIPKSYTGKMVDGFIFVSFSSMFNFGSNQGMF